MGLIDRLFMKRDKSVQLVSREVVEEPLPFPEGFGSMVHQIMDGYTNDSRPSILF